MADYKKSVDSYFSNIGDLSNLNPGITNSAEQLSTIRLNTVKIDYTTYIIAFVIIIVFFVLFSLFNFSILKFLSYLNLPFRYQMGKQKYNASTQKGIHFF